MSRSTFRTAVWDQRCEGNLRSRGTWDKALRVLFLLKYSETTGIRNYRMKVGKIKLGWGVLVSRQ